MQLILLKFNKKIFWISNCAFEQCCSACLINYLFIYCKNNNLFNFYFVLLDFVTHEQTGVVFWNDIQIRKI
jgi:hypothetical protein